MSISTQIDRIKNAVETAYAKLKSKGATVPEQQTLDNLPTCIDSIPSVADADAEIYDIYNGKTAIGANGELITGGLIGYSAVLNRNDTGCSSTELVFNCPYEPKLIVVSLLSATTESSDANTVVDLLVWRVGAFAGANAASTEYYCGHSIGTYSSGKFTILRHQTEIKGNTSVFYWDNGKVHIKSPSSTYKFSAKNYRLVCFK